MAVNQNKTEDFLSTLKNGYPDDEELERTMNLLRILIFRNGEELTQLYLK